MKAISVKKKGTFFKKRARLISFAGALVVFLTFMVRDAMKDKLKDLVDASVSARSEFFRDEQLIETPAAFDRVEWALEALRLQLTKDKHVEGTLTAEQQEWRLTQQRLNRISELEDAILGFMSAVPDGDRAKQAAIQSELAHLENRTTALMKEVKEGHELVVDSTAYGGHTTPDELSRKIKQECEKLMEDALSYSEEVTERKKHELTICTWASYGLYALGWGLALAGRLFGVEGLVGAE
jgi:hypothetical protein